MTSEGRHPDETPAYTVHMERKDGRFFLRIRELSLIVEDDDLDAAYAELEQRKREVIDKFVRLGREREIPQPEEAKARSATRKALAPFFIKAAVVALVGAILIATSHVAVLYALQEAPRTVGLKAGRAALKGVISGLEKFARQDITPEREERLRLAIRAAVPRLQPFVQELRPLMACAGPTADDGQTAAGTQAPQDPRQK